MLELSAAKRFGDFHLDVELAVDDEVVVLLGPSGAGKSLTLQSIAGLVEPDRGRIAVNGRVLFDAERKANLRPQARRVGYVFQNYALFPHLSVADNVGYGLHNLPAPVRRERVSALLASVRLDGFEDRHPRELSGGEQQRVALARALAIEPEILLLDEPFSALDAPVRADLRREFLSLRRRTGIPALFVTHDLEEASMLADRLAVIIAGSIRQVGPPRQVLDRPLDPEVAALVQARNLLPGVATCDDDGMKVRTPIGQLEAARDCLEPDAAVSVMIRPEVIRIVQPDRPLSRLRDDLIVSGVVEEILDYGVRTVVWVDVAGTVLEISLSPTAAMRQRLQVGDDVRLSIPHSDVHLMQNTEKAPPRG